MKDGLLVEGKSPHKAFQVRLEGDTNVIASFDSVEDAIAHIRKLRLDRKHEIIHHRKVVWPSIK